MVQRPFLAGGSERLEATLFFTSKIDQLLIFEELIASMVNFVINAIPSGD
jgi:hypothetical protein